MLSVVVMGRKVARGLEWKCSVRDDNLEVVIVTAAFPTGGSEYGGKRGPLAPPPHSVNDVAWEQASLAVRTSSGNVFGTVTAAETVEGVYAEDMKKVTE